MPKSSAVLALCLACTSACSVSSAMPPERAAPAAASSARVVTQLVAAQDVPEWLLLTGQLKGSRETDLAANARGRIVSTNVERGQFVKAGQVLATLDVRAAELNAQTAAVDAQNAQAQAESAALECARARALVASGALSAQQAERLEAQCKTSELQVSAAQGRARLAAQSASDGVIRAPFAGFIAERYVEVGEYVQAEARVVTLVDLSNIRLELTIPEANIAAAEPGRRVRFSVAAYPGRSFGGTLKFVSSAVRPGTRDVVAEALVDTADASSGVLRAGMFAAVQLQTGHTRAPVIPKRALLPRDGQQSAFVLKNGRLEQRIVQLGEPVGPESVAVLRGVSAGEALVQEPGTELRNGQAAL